jgi:hypothetical protein
MLTWAVKKIFFSFWLSFEIQLKFLTDSWWTCATLQIAVLKCIFLSLVKKIYLRNDFTKSENFKVSAISSEEFSTMSFGLQSVEYFFAETHIEDWFEYVWEFFAAVLWGFKKRFSKASTNWISDIHFMLCKYVNHFPFSVACLLMLCHPIHFTHHSCHALSSLDMLWMVMESSSRIRWMNEKMKKSFEIWRHAWPFPIESTPSPSLFLLFLPNDINHRSIEPYEIREACKGGEKL